LGIGTGFGASFDREESGVSGSTVDFELLTMGTSLDELVHEVSESRPEVISLDGDPGGLLSWVSRCGEIVILSGDFSAEVNVVGDIGSPSIGKEGPLFGGQRCPSLGSRLRRELRVRGREDLLCEEIACVSLDELGSEGGVVDTLLAELEGGDKAFLREQGSFLRFVVVAGG
jgi:hypothetical protein